MGCSLLWEVEDGEKTDDENDMLYLISSQQSKHILFLLSCGDWLGDVQCGMFYYHHLLI